MEALQVGHKYRHPKTGAVMRITEVDEGKVPAWPHPMDLRFVVEEGSNPGRQGVATLVDGQTWIPVDRMLAHWDGIQWTTVNEETASNLHVAMSFARVSGYGELNPNITLLVPQCDQRRVEEHHARWLRLRGKCPF